MTEAEIRQMQLQTKACQGSPATTKSYGFPGGAVAKNLPAMQEMQETRVRSLGWKDPLEEGMSSCPSILAWEIPWTEEHGRL